MRGNWTRRGFLAATTSIAFAPRAFADMAALSFLVVGDWGERSNGQAAVADAMARTAETVHSAFVVSTGDNFYSRGVDSVDDPQWTATFEQAFSAASLQTPWYAVLGNHDYRGSVAAEVAYTINSPRWRMPARYWRQDVAVGAQTASFFMLDSYPLTHLPSLLARTPIVGDADESHAQLTWLERELAASQARWKFVVGHHPILSSGSHGGARALYEHVRPLLQRYGVSVYFNGHDHNLEHLQEDGVNYVCSGAGSEFRPLREPLPQTRFAFSGLGFVSCRVSETDGVSVDFHDANGATLYTTTAS